MNERILHIIKSHAVAGAENHLFMLLPALAERGYDIHLLNLNDRGDSKKGLTDEYRQKLASLKEQGVEVHYGAVRSKWDVTAAQHIKKKVRAVCPDVVHTHLPYADLVGALAARWAGAPIVLCSRHHDYSTSRRERIKYPVYYFLANRLHDGEIAISDRVASLCRSSERISSLYTVLYGCKDQQVNHRQARNKLMNELGLQEDVLILGTVARLIHLKGHRFAVKAMSRLKQQFDNVRWLFVGDGPEKEKLKQMALERGVDDEIVFLGYREDVPTLMAAMDLMVHPTTGEGFGLVFLEAMIQQTPILTARVGAAPEIVVEGETGLLVESRNPQALSEAAARLIGNPELRAKMGNAGRRRYEKAFSVETMAENTAQVYEQLVH